MKKQRLENQNAKLKVEVESVELGSGSASSLAPAKLLGLATLLVEFSGQDYLLLQLLIQDFPPQLFCKALCNTQIMKKKNLHKNAFPRHDFLSRVSVAH